MTLPVREKQGKSIEVNRRLVYSMRSLGKGHSGAKKFCTLMNMPPPLVKCAYKKASQTIAKKLKALQRKVWLKLPLKYEMQRMLVVMM